MTLTRSLNTVAAGLTASDISLTDANIIAVSPRVASRAAGYFSTIGNRNSSTAEAATAASTISATGSARSACSTWSRRTRVDGWRGVNSWQQSWSGMIEMGYVPSRSASAVISSLSIPTSGLSTSIVVASAMLVMFSSVWEATWPMTSPVTSARARQRRASFSAMRIIRRR